MRYKFVPMNSEYADEIVSDWHYDGIYAFYDMTADEEDLKIFLNRDYWEDTTFAALDENKILAAFASFHMEEGVMWLSLGMKPELTGHGMGEEFVTDCVEFARSHYNLTTQPIWLDVAVFNERAIKVYKKAGFHETTRFTRFTNGGEYEFLRMALEP